MTNDFVDIVDGAGAGAGTYVYGDNAYAQVADVSSYGGSTFDVPAGVELSDIQSALMTSTQRIAAACRDHFGLSLRTLILNGHGTPYLDMTQRMTWPCVSVSSVYYRNTYADGDDFETNGELVDADYYAVSGSRRMLVKISGQTFRTSGSIDSCEWVRGIRNYRVRGYFGRSEIPEPIRWACVLLARELITPGSSDQYAALSSERFPDGYSYEVAASSPSSSSAGGLMLTGVAAVDNLLRRGFVNDMPLFVAPGFLG